ncbi:unnamed protein product [Adineta ricciae]|uniref:Protein sleepless n=1 Tax=Adineta ricciae TaxID=249248 RepID=A0A814FD86_ADIRI|nr:unnamed protein product [Adineta ricciae]
MKLLFVALLFLCVAWFADAYECYICNNLMTGACGDPFDKSKISNTSIVEIAPYERCAKSKIGTAVRRTKVNSTECPGAKNGCEPRMDDGVKAMVCCCDSDLCNQTSSLRQPIWLLLIALIICGLFVQS